MPSLQQFTEMTINVIAGEGLDGYLPTLMIPSRKIVGAIEDIPDDVAHADYLQDVIEREGLSDQELFFGVQTGPREITTGHYTPEGISFMRIIEGNDGYTVSTVEDCSWWRLGR